MSSSKANPAYEVILTHEHTDFDALASLLGASLLFPQAKPVLPRQLNRNVRGFLTLYRNQFPFLTDEELPKGDIKRAIFVDTDAANWVKGMHPTTPQLIIDHHAPQESDGSGGKAYQNLWHEDVGANTTILVEQIITRGIKLSSLQATLLALGIHEDTGSLTYAATTYRDAQALAWLMHPDRAVNLQVLAQYLTHPLTPAQRALLQQLIDHSHFYGIAGHNIVIAQAEAPAFEDELSALTARLQEIHETDALFMIVRLDEVIQVVARSTNDAVDVGAVAKALGGGGHARAAAAPIREPGHTTETVSRRILDLLRRHTRAAVTVQQIMSSGRPQSLQPDMSIETAAQLMRRYGHEGFLVLANGGGREELLGVLTRREADRALDHGMGDQPVRRFMRTGAVSVKPDTPIAELRRTMIDSGWGQIPVINQEGEIIGIVTRTDLIKLWDAEELPENRAGMIAQRLHESLTPDHHALLQRIGAEVDRLDYTVYVVGGFVRDLLLNGRTMDVAALDMDMVIEGDAIAFARHVQRRYGGRIVPHKRFNTAKWLLDDPDSPVDTGTLGQDLGIVPADLDLPGHLDFVTARTEFYTAPSALPTVEDSSIKLDLHRRDFTINTLAICLNPDRWGELLDFYGGARDLEQGLVRVLHSLSFVDDPTRILRAVRYEQRFHFTIEARTLELLQDAIELIDRVSPARVRHELERILLEERPERALHRLDDLGVLAQIHPALHMQNGYDAQFAALRAARAQSSPGDPLVDTPIDQLYWGILVHNLAPESQQELAERLGLQSATQELTQGLAHVRAHADELDQADLAPSRVAAFLRRVNDAALALAPILWHHRATLLRHIEEYRTRLRHIKPLLDGHDLIRLGIPRGPRYSEILQALQAAKLDGRLPDREAEEQFVLAYADGMGYQE